MDCIRINGKGDLFDFIKYDSLFEGIGETKDRILIAISRLKSAVSLMPAYRSKYERYLRENPKEAIAHTVRYDDVDGCSILCSLDVVNASNVDNAILLATGQEKVSVAAFFMQHKNKTLPDFDAFADFNLEL